MLHINAISEEQQEKGLKKKKKKLSPVQVIQVT